MVRAPSHMSLHCPDRLKGLGQLLILWGVRGPVPLLRQGSTVFQNQNEHSRVPTPLMNWGVCLVTPQLLHPKRCFRPHNRGNKWVG